MFFKSLLWSTPLSPCQCPACRATMATCTTGLSSCAWTRQGDGRQSQRGHHYRFCCCRSLQCHRCSAASPVVPPVGLLLAPLFTHRGRGWMHPRAPFYTRPAALGAFDAPIFRALPTRSLLAQRMRSASLKRWWCACIPPSTQPPLCCATHHSQSGVACLVPVKMKGHLAAPKVSRVRPLSRACWFRCGASAPAAAH